MPTQSSIPTGWMKARHTSPIDFAARFLAGWMFIGFCLAAGRCVPVNQTPMIVGDIEEADPSLELIRTGYALSDPNLQDYGLDIYKQDFRIEVFDAQGALIAELGSKTKNEFANALDFLSDGVHLRWEVAYRTMGSPTSRSSRARPFTALENALMVSTKWARRLDTGNFACVWKHFWPNVQTSPIFYEHPGLWCFPE